MKDSSTAVSQVSLLKQKLNSAKLALEEIHEDRNEKLRTLIQFLGHLSLACKGQNLELDNRLAKLRHHLQGYDQIDEALPELVEIERLLKGQYNHTMTQLEESRTSLSRVISQIQRVDSAPEEIKKEINYFKKISINRFIPFGSTSLKLNKSSAFTSIFYKSNLQVLMNTLFCLSTLF